MISPSGRMLWAVTVVAVPLCALAGFATGLLMPCVVLLCLLGAFAALDAWRGMRRVSKLTATSGEAEWKWFKGRESTIPLRLEGSPGRYEVALELPSGLSARSPVVAVDAGESTVIDMPCLAEQRGRYRVGKCFVRTSSPWKLWQMRDTKALTIGIRVYPDLEKETGAKLLFHGKRIGLRRQVPAGRGREFERLREYAHGDSYDEISWKATARRGRPVVKVFQIERTQDVYVILDASRRSARHERLERFVSAALMVALSTESEGDNFGLLAFQDRVTHFVQAARGANHFARCRDAIFDLQSSRVTPDFSELFTFLQLRVKRRALLLFLTDLEDATLAETFSRDAQVLARKHLVVVGRSHDDDAQPLFSGAAPDDIADINSQLAGHMQWAKLRELEKNLQRMGVGVCILRPGLEGMDLVEKYSEIKRRQVL
jgi:uncharacterized protein (DUF58 family)